MAVQRRSSPAEGADQTAATATATTTDCQYLFKICKFSENEVRERALAINNGLRSRQSGVLIIAMMK